MHYDLKKKKKKLDIKNINIQCYSNVAPTSVKE